MNKIRNKPTDKTYLAVQALDLFTKIWCFRADDGTEPMFECDECPFSCQNGKCSVKMFKQDRLPLYRNFGYMGDL